MLSPTYQYMPSSIHSVSHIVSPVLNQVSFQGMFHESVSALLNMQTQHLASGTNDTTQYKQNPSHTRNRLGRRNTLPSRIARTNASSSSSVSEFDNNSGQSVDATSPPIWLFNGLNQAGQSASTQTHRPPAQTAR